jgi:hypothetical protein
MDGSLYGTGGISTSPAPRWPRTDRPLLRREPDRPEDRLPRVPVLPRAEVALPGLETLAGLEALPGLEAPTGPGADETAARPQVVQ